MGDTSMSITLPSLNKTFNNDAGASNTGNIDISHIDCDDTNMMQMLQNNNNNNNNGGGADDDVDVTSKFT